MSERIGPLDAIRVAMSSDELSRETHRRLPIEGGTWICSRCNDDRVPGSAYCRKHKNEYQRDWSGKNSRELKRLRELVSTLAPVSKDGL